MAAEVSSPDSFQVGRQSLKSAHITLPSNSTANSKCAKNEQGKCLPCVRGGAERQVGVHELICRVKARQGGREVWQIEWHLTRQGWAALLQLGLFYSWPTL